MPTSKVKTVKKITPAKPSETKKTPRKTGLTLPLYDLAGSEKTGIELPKEIFDTTSNPKLLAQYIRVYLANQRTGTASTKTRGEVRGSTRKIYRQKGTGRARHGSRRAPIFVGGGIIGGPRPKDFSLKINKKQKRKALFSALTMKYKEENTLGLVNESIKTEPKTKIIMKFLKQINIEKKKILLVLPHIEKSNLELATRNIQSITVAESQSINPYIVLNNDKIIFTQGALDELKKHFLKIS